MGVFEKLRRKTLLELPLAGYDLFKALRRQSSRDLESTKPCLNAIIADAVIFAERIMQRIDSAFPSARERIG